MILQDLLINTIKKKEHENLLIIKIVVQTKKKILKSFNHKNQGSGK